MSPPDGTDDAEEEPPPPPRRQPPHPVDSANASIDAAAADPAAASPNGRLQHRQLPDPAGERNGGNRAGRNLPAAVAVGVGLAAAVLASLLLWRPAFLAIVVAAVAVAIWEMVRAVRTTQTRPPLPPLLAGGAAMPVVAWFWGPEGLALALLATALAVMVWRLGGGPAGYLRDIGAGALIAVYLPFLAGFVALLAAPENGHWQVLAMLGVVVLSDIGGYAVGVFLGRHPLAPTISPNKSWEGLAGSLLAAAAGGAIGFPLIFEGAWWWGAVFGLVVAGAAVLGDLVESLLKRDLGVKDMSDLLPGHGGVMDRADSILFAAPTAYLLLAVLAG